MEKILIGLVGEKGSGKGTFVKFLKNLFPSNVSIGHIKSVDVLAETLKIWNLPLTRENLQQLAIAMDAAYGRGTLTRAVYQRIQKSDSKIVVFDGIRWESDFEMIQEFPRKVLVYITADAEIRYKRVKGRGEKEGETEATYEQFLKEEQKETELKIREIGSRADVEIINNDTMNALSLKVFNVYNYLLKSIS